MSRGNVALIGDASGTVDAITGEGLCLAFSQAMVLAECLERAIWRVRGGTSGSHCGHFSWLG